MSRSSLCRTSVTLQRHNLKKDTSGGMTFPAWQAVGNAVKADIQPASSGTILRYAQKQIEVSHTVFLLSDVGGKAGDRLQTNDGRNFKVEGYRKSAPGYKDWPYVADVIEDPQ